MSLDPERIHGGATQDRKRRYEESSNAVGTTLPQVTARPERAGACANTSRGSYRSVSGAEPVVVTPYICDA